MIRNLKNDNSNIVNLNSIGGESNPRLIDPGSRLEQSLYFNSISPDDMKKFIKHVELKIRTSDMYSTYLHMLINSGLDHCSIKGNITNEDASIEFHHYPFTLYDIVYTMIKYKMANNEKISSFSLTKDVMEEHSKNIIGLLPLSKTYHELYHSGSLSITLDMVYGNIQGFIDKYEDFMSDDMIEKYNKAVIMTDRINKEKEINNK